MVRDGKGGRIARTLLRESLGKSASRGILRRVKTDPRKNLSQGCNGVSAAVSGGATLLRTTRADTISKTPA